VTSTDIDPGKQRKYDRLVKSPYFDQVVAANRAYLVAAVPDAATTERDYWTLSCIPGRSTTLSRISMSGMEVFVVGVAAAGAGGLDGFVVVSESVLLQGFGSVAGFAARFPECFDVEKSGYRVAGEDQLRIWGAQSDLISALASDPFAGAARALAGRLMRGRTSYSQVLRGLDTDRAGNGKPVTASGQGFDRPYSGRPEEGSYPIQQATGGEAHERARTEHNDICRRLIDHLGLRGIKAGEHLDEVKVDLAWHSGSGRQVIAEVKSCAGANDQDQLRLGLGQVLEYRTRLVNRGHTVDCCLVVSRVLDTAWFDVCEQAGVVLIDAGRHEAFDSLDAGRDGDANSDAVGRPLPRPRTVSPAAVRP
jgi:hypothetical protein